MLGSVGEGDDFSVGSGLLRTVSAGAGISLFPSRPVASPPFRKNARRRYHRNNEMARARKIKEPMIAPARAPLLTPPDLPVLSVPLSCATHLNELQEVQSLEVTRSGKVRWSVWTKKYRPIYLEAILVGSAVAGRWVGANDTIRSSLPREEGIETHEENNGKRKSVCMS